MTAGSSDEGELHRTLTRQLRRLRLAPDRPPGAESWAALLADVSAIYIDNDLDRAALERAIDVSGREMRTLNDRLTLQAATDPLTGLLNRASLMEELTALALRTANGERWLGVLFIDLDGFKLINDRLGHATGDNVLQVVGNRLTACVRSVDVAARQGGDEFVLLAPDLASPAEASNLATRVVAALGAPVEIEGRQPIGVGASAGVALLPPGEYATADRLLAEADAAMYVAKMGGHDRVVVFTPELVDPADRVEDPTDATP